MGADDERRRADAELPVRGRTTGLDERVDASGSFRHSRAPVAGRYFDPRSGTDRDDGAALERDV